MLVILEVRKSNRVLTNLPIAGFGPMGLKRPIRIGYLAIQGMVHGIGIITVFWNNKSIQWDDNRCSIAYSTIYILPLTFNTVSTYNISL